MTPQIYEILIEALRVLYICMVPVIIAITIVGVVVSAIQSASTVQEQALSYAAKILSIFGLFYFLGATIFEMMQQVALRAFGP